ncbi:MAG: hypothetical protein ACM3MN_10150 [Nitrospirota bacterium]
MWKDIIAALKALDFKHLNEILSQLDMLEVLKNPWVIVAMVIPCIVFVIRGMEKALVGFLSVPALIVLFQKTVQGKSMLEFDAERLFVFVVGFLIIAGINIYFWVVRGK